MIHRQHAERVAALIEDAVMAGSRLACGGGFDTGARYVAPTILTGVPLRARIRSEEIFGPVLPILTFEFLDAVIAEINAAPRPRALYTWTRDAHVIRTLRTRTSSGSLGVNLCLPRSGGVKGSGIASAHGVHGFKAFSHYRALMSAGPWAALRPLFPPYGA
jgi:aldehyde dehydrogenase (NAD+)